PGRLDRALFDVTGLLRLGYDDAARADLPLIVSYDGAAPRAAVAGGRATRDLPAVHGAAVTAETTGAYWRSLTSTAPAAGAPAPGTQAPGTLAARKVWLDGRARLLDDASNAQIGAPL